MDSQNLESLAMKAARLYRCTFFITGETDIVSDGTQTLLLRGGDSRLCSRTGHKVQNGGGIGQFHALLMDVAEEKIYFANRL